MRPGFFVVVIILFFATARAQHTMHLEVNDFTRRGDIFLSGVINNWNPADNKYKLTRINYFRHEISLYNLPPGRYEFKFTRGSKETAEATANGHDVPDRVVILDRDTTVLFSIQGWKDFKDSPLLNTDSARMSSALSKGLLYINTNPDSAFKYALQTFVLSANVSPEMKAYATNLQGEVLLKFGNTTQALELFKEGLRIRESRQNPTDSGAISYLLNEIGDTYWQARDTLNAVKYYKLSMLSTPSFAYFHPLHENICNRLCNVGRALLGKHNLDSAQWYATQSTIVGDRVSAITDLFWGDLKLAEGKKVDAMNYYRSAVRNGRDHDHNLTIVLQSYDRMLALFETFNKPDSVNTYARRLFDAALTLQNNDAISKSGQTLARLFRNKNQFDSAFYYQQQVINANEKQITQAKERQALNSYFTEKIKEQQSIAAENQRASAIWMYGLVSIVMLVIVFAVIYRLKMKSGYDKKMKEIEMRALRAQMNPHFIFNCLGSINRYIVKSDTKTASNYLTKFSKLIRLILDNSATDHINLDAEIQTLQLYLDMESLRFDYGFDYEIQRDENLDESNVHIPSMLIQPYIENAIWHGLLQKEEKGKLWVRFNRINGHILKVEIEDDGIGRKRAAELKSKGTIKQKSYGMQISSDRIQLINNLYRLNNSVTIHDLVDDKGEASGTKITLNIPI